METLNPTPVKPTFTTEKLSPTPNHFHPAGNKLLVDMLIATPCGGTQCELRGNFNSSCLRLRPCGEHGNERLAGAPHHAPSKETQSGSMVLRRKTLPSAALAHKFHQALHHRGDGVRWLPSSIPPGRRVFLQEPSWPRAAQSQPSLITALSRRGDVSSDDKALCHACLAAADSVMAGAGMLLQITASGCICVARTLNREQKHLCGHLAAETLSARRNYP